MYTVLVPQMYDWNVWYDADETPLTGKQLPKEGEGIYVLFENKLLGLPRIRQLRVKNNSCEIPADFANDIKTCYDNYHPDIEDKLFHMFNQNESEYAHPHYYSDICLCYS